MMTVKMIMTGDVNLMNVADPGVPFAKVADEFCNTDVVFSNLECCLCEAPPGHSAANEGFFADPKAGKALTLGGIQVVGIANNVHYGEAAILSSIARLDELGVLHTGAGANLVVGHGRHYALAVEVYKGRPIFYGLGSFSFHTGHGGRRHDSWVGMIARIAARRGGVESATFQFVRHNERNETYLCSFADEAEAFAEITKASKPLGTRWTTEGDQVRVKLTG